MWNVMVSEEECDSRKCCCLIGLDKSNICRKV